MFSSMSSAMVCGQFSTKMVLIWQIRLEIAGLGQEGLAPHTHLSDILVIIIFFTIFARSINKYIYHLL